MAGDEQITLGFLDPIDIEISGRPRSVVVKGISAKVSGTKVNGFFTIVEGTTQGPTVRIGQVVTVEVSGDEWPVVVNSFNLKARIDDLTGTIGIRSPDDEPDVDPDDQDQRDLFEGSE